jgi:hypothetical protein
MVITERANAVRSASDCVSIYRTAWMHSLMNIGAMWSSIIFSSSGELLRWELWRIFSPLSKCIIALEKCPRRDSKQTNIIQDIKAVSGFCFRHESDLLKCPIALVYWSVANPQAVLAASHFVSMSRCRFEKSSCRAPRPMTACRSEGSATLACRMSCSQKELSKYPLSSTAVFVMKY